MTARARICRSRKEAFRLLVNSLKQESLKYSIGEDAHVVILRMSGDVQPYTIVGEVSDKLMLFAVVKFLNLPKNLDSEQQRRLFEKLLEINDRFGVVKFSVDVNRQAVTISVEIPWRDLGFTSRTISTYFNLLASAARINQRELLSIIVH